MKERKVWEVAKWFNLEIRKHPSFLLYDLQPTNFFVPSETYTRSLLGNSDKGLHILDVGCGDGRDSITLAASSNKVWAIDIAINRLKIAQDNVKKANLTSRILPICMDAHNLAFPDNAFDLIVGNSILLFLDRPRFAKECNRVLRSGGHALFSNESMKKHPLLRLRRALSKVHERESVANRISLDDITELKEYFDYVNHQEFYLLSVFLAPAVMKYGKWKIISVLANFFYRLDSLLLKQIPILKGLCWISVIDLWKRPDLKK